MQLSARVSKVPVLMTQATILAELAPRDPHFVQVNKSGPGQTRDSPDRRTSDAREVLEAEAGANFHSTWAVWGLAPAKPA